MPNLKELLRSGDGRIGRQTFALLAVGFFVVSVVAGFIPILGPLLNLALLWPWTVIAAKRLHDMGRTGAYAVALAAALTILYAVSLAAGLLVAVPGVFLVLVALAGGLGGLLAIVSLAFLLWIALSKGTPGPNRYGEPELPKVAGLFSA